MDSNISRISFQRRLGMREEISQRWPALRKFITSDSELEAAFVNFSKSAEGRLPSVDKGSAEEVLDFYNKVVADGRYLDEMVDNPSEVARKLGVQVSEETLGQFREIAVLLPGGARMNLAVVAIAVAVTVVIVKGSDPLEQIVVDQSGRVKL